MSLSYYPGLDDHDNTNRLCTISPSVPPADHWILPTDHGILPAGHGIPPADHGISEPPPSPKESKMLPPPTPSTKGKENDKDETNV
jgi:hypothetical protein